MVSRFALIGVILVAAATTALADPAPKIDMGVSLFDETGMPIKDQFDRGGEKDLDCAKCGYLTIARAAIHALLTQFPDETGLSGEDKWARANLAKQIKDNAHAASLTSEEVSVVKRLIGKLYGPVVIGQVYPILDPNGAPPRVK